MTPAGSRLEEEERDCCIISLTFINALEEGHDSPSKDGCAAADCGLFNFITRRAEPGARQGILEEIGHDAAVIFCSSIVVAIDRLYQRGNGRHTNPGSYIRQQNGDATDSFGHPIAASYLHKDGYTYPINNANGITQANGNPNANQHTNANTHNGRLGSRRYSHARFRGYHQF